ncbi:helix-turn-helix domain-containing protein [Parabacteroides pacaensis]|uniref:helix-turn-helix domain-containing protein n=1 Tax=Parabacteroides pacaensis TaxID=2086575 RepID=UPI000D100B69|nr:helix-turn-helix domain-containing protein [Parabacteroides pacaensis]
MEKSEILEALIDYFCKGNKAQFACKLGVKPQTINTWITRNTFDIDLIYSKCERISGDWLLTGKGEMLKSNPFDLEEDSLTMRAAEPTVEYSRISPITQERLFNIIESQQRTIENLSKR